MPILNVYLNKEMYDKVLQAAEGHDGKHSKVIQELVAKHLKE